MDFLPLLFFVVATTELWLPLTKLALSTSTDGDSAENGVAESSGGKEVCRSGCDIENDAVDMFEAFRRFKEGDGDPSATARFFFTPPIVLKEGDVYGEAISGYAPDGRNRPLWRGTELNGMLNVKCRMLEKGR